MSARQPVMLLCVGSYLLGVATSLLSIHFSSDDDLWKGVMALLVVLLASANLAAGLFLIRSRESLQRSGSSGKADVSVRGETPASPGTQLAGNSGTRSPRERPMVGREEPEKRATHDAVDRPVSSNRPTRQVSVSERPGPTPRTRIERRQGPSDKTSLPSESGRLPVEPQASDLIHVWDTYRREGDGHFTKRGLQEQLDDMEFQATVSADDRVGSSDCLLVVQTESQGPAFFVLPSFAKSPRAVQRWFADRSDGALNRTIHQVAEVAEGRWTRKGAEVANLGVVA